VAVVGRTDKFMFVLLRLLQKILVDDLTQCTVYNGTKNHETEEKEKK